MIRLSAIASVYNEADLLGQFLRHYSPRVDTVFLIDNESDDGSLEQAAAYPNVELSSYSSGGVFDERLKTEALLAKKKECVGKYDYVLLLDSDEFLVAKSGLPLRDELGRLPGHPVHGTTGISIYGYPDDPPYDPRRPLIEQRKRGIENAQYGKPIVVRPEYEARYSLGCHYLADKPPPILAPFFLLHYRAFDREIFVRRSLRFAGRLTEAAFHRGSGVYYYGRTQEDFRRRYDLESVSGKIVQMIP